MDGIDEQAETKTVGSPDGLSSPAVPAQIRT
jgi:hypothetical protein